MVIFILVVDIMLNLLIGLTPFTDNFMHLGGFLLGTFCASTMLNEVNLFGMHFHQEALSFRHSLVSRYFGLIVSLLCMVAATVVLFMGDGVTSPCPSCGVLSCVSFPPWENYENRWWFCDDCGEVKGLGRIDERTGEYYAIELKCPEGETVIFNLDDDIDKSHEALEKYLPSFCREKCPR